MFFFTSRTPTFSAWHAPFFVRGEMAARSAACQRGERRVRFAEGMAAEATASPCRARTSQAEGMDAELMALSLKSPPETMRRSAAYFLERGEPEKAAALLHKAGDVSRASGAWWTQRLLICLQRAILAISCCNHDQESRAADRVCLGWRLFFAILRWRGFDVAPTASQLLSLK